LTALTRRLERIEPRRERNRILVWRDASDTDEVMQAKIDDRLKAVGATRDGDVEVHVLRWNGG